MISVEGLKVEFGVKPLFTDVGFVVNDTDRIALVGKTVPANRPYSKSFAGGRNLQVAWFQCLTTRL